MDRPTTSEKTPGSREAAQTWVPMDSLTSWLICMCGVFVQFVVGGILTSFAVFFLPLVEEFKATRAEVAAVGAIALGVAMVTSPLAGLLRHRMHARSAMMAGTMLCTCGLLTSSLVTHFQSLFVSFALMFGVGTGLSLTPTLLFGSELFEKYRSAATLMTSSALFMGTVVSAPVAQVLVSFKGWRFALKILSGACALTTITSYFVRSSGPDRQQEEMVRSDRHALVVQLGLWKSRPLLFWMLAVAVAMPTAWLPYVHLVPHGRDVGVTGLQGAVLLAILSGGHVVGTLILTRIVQRGGLSRLSVLQMAMTLSGATTFLLPSCSSFPALAVFAVVRGVVDASLLMLVPLITCSFAGMNRMFLPMILFSSAGAVLIIFGSSFAGYLCDVGGSYDAAFLVGGVPAVVGVLLLQLLPWSQRTSTAVNALASLGLGEAALDQCPDLDPMLHPLLPDNASESSLARELVATRDAIMHDDLVKDSTDSWLTKGEMEEVRHTRTSSDVSTDPAFNLLNLLSLIRPLVHNPDFYQVSRSMNRANEGACLSQPIDIPTSKGLEPRPFCRKYSEQALRRRGPNVEEKDTAPSSSPCRPEGRGWLLEERGTGDGLDAEHVQEGPGSSPESWRTKNRKLREIMESYERTLKMMEEGVRPVCQGAARTDKERSCRGKGGGGMASHCRSRTLSHLDSLPSRIEDGRSKTIPRANVRGRPRRGRCNDNCAVPLKGKNPWRPFDLPSPESDLAPKAAAKGRQEGGEVKFKTADTTSGPTRGHRKKEGTRDVILAVMEELRGLLSSPRIVERIVSAAMAEAAPDPEAAFLQVQQVLTSERAGNDVLAGRGRQGYMRGWGAGEGAGSTGDKAGGPSSGGLSMNRQIIALLEHDSPTPPSGCTPQPTPSPSSSWQRGSPALSCMCLLSDSSRCGSSLPSDPDVTASPSTQARKLSNECITHAPFNLPGNPREKLSIPEKYTTSDDPSRINKRLTDKHDPDTSKLDLSFAANVTSVDDKSTHPVLVPCPRKGEKITHHKSDATDFRRAKSGQTLEKVSFGSESKGCPKSSALDRGAVHFVASPPWPPTPCRSEGPIESRQPWRRLSRTGASGEPSKIPKSQSSSKTGSTLGRQKFSACSSSSAGVLSGHAVTAPAAETCLSYKTTASRPAELAPERAFSSRLGSWKPPTPRSCPGSFRSGAQSEVDGFVNAETENIELRPLINEEGK